MIFRTLHHRGVPPANFEGPGPGLLPEDEICVELRRAGLHLSQPTTGLRTPRSVYISVTFLDECIYKYADQPQH